MSQPKDDPLWKEAVASAKLTKHQDDIRRGLRPKPKATKPKKAKVMFLPYAATCNHCDDLMVTVRPRHFVTCSCGASNLDAGDGYYWRCGGEISQVWKLRKGTLANPYTSWKRINFPTK